MKPAIIDITGIGPAAAAALGEHGFSSVKALAGADVAQVATVPGFSEMRAQKTIAAAAELLAASGNPGKGGKDKKKKDKKKKDKKGKKGKGKSKK